MSSTISTREMDPLQADSSIHKQQHNSKATCDRNQSTSISTSSSLLTNSSSSPSSSLTSISTNSPTSTSISNSQSMRSVSICLNSTENFPLDSARLTNSAALDQHQMDAIKQLGQTPAVAASSQANINENMNDSAPLCNSGMAQQDDNYEVSAEHENLDKELAAERSSLEGRQERSNSCSQAETSGALAGFIPSVGIGSLSQECIAKQANSSANQATNNVGGADSITTNHQLSDMQVNGRRLISGSNAANNQLQSTFSSAKFFSSKLNTGSLWSLMSAGSNNSTCANEASSLSNDNPELIILGNLQKQHVDSCKPERSNTDNKQPDNSTNKLGAFFSRVQQFKRNTQPSIEDRLQVDQKPVLSKHPTSSNLGTSESMGAESSVTSERTRFRFNLKYIGSALLHKNFTLPMLEWIAKDIRRQTIRGAQSISHRQFTIPTRDIVLEIQSYQLTAISCKDGHCVFVHPMPCVSKYAQLQHDPTCFSYLIRDSKDSPLFCHVFQAKSAHKVHDIFRAIREATTQTTKICQSTLPPSPLPPPTISSSKSLKGSSSVVQRSASLEMRSLLGPSQRQTAELRKVSHSSASPVIGAPRASSGVKPSLDTSDQSSQQNPDQPASQFESSYQFEVMFVKKVKLQCRRVPATFVDDALETLKSFEVLKGGESKAQIKGLGKRIISASVDERQEYDEACQSPTPSGSSNPIRFMGTPQQQQREVQELSTSLYNGDDHRRGSSVSLHKQDETTIREERESRSCQQSPTKLAVDSASCIASTNDSPSRADSTVEMKKHQSMDCLKNINCSIRSAREGKAPIYSNDFSPYNTITSTDLNERIAAIPVVSSSVSLDHETRQKLARQVRETIMATAANIKKGVYASGDKLDSSASSKALDSLSCTSAGYEPAEENESNEVTVDQVHNMSDSNSSNDNQSDRITTTSDHRRSSASASSNSFQHQSANNFDLFRRASARQVVKNRTMLLLIGKDELCTISIDKHQILFSKSFNSIVHCLQGSNNKDHFGLICRDSGKINPNTESYAGFIFRCQSDKVVREIMGALKQVIYSSQHNYHGYNSPYNPLNTAVTSNKYKPQQTPKLEQAQINSNVAQSDKRAAQSPEAGGDQLLQSLASKRGFANPIEVIEAARHNRSAILSQKSIEIGCSPSIQTPGTSAITTCTTATPTVAHSQPKNLIKSMFCDNCPLYWYHRLCCDIESLPAETSKAIILRRIDSSLSDKEQDELYSKFSEFSIESVEEHNEIFMSLLRHQCEKKQAKHGQSHSHLESMARNSALAKQSSTTPLMSRRPSTQKDSSSSSSNSSTSSTTHHPFSMNSGHQRSGSSSGSLAFVIGQANANQAGQSIADAGTVAMDNLKKAKNSISSSIENMLKRRSSMRDDQDHEEPSQLNVTLPTRSGSFKSTSREWRAVEMNRESGTDSSSSLKRSQSTSDYSKGQQQTNTSNIAIWKDSLSRTINDDLANPLVGLFRRRDSLAGTRPGDPEQSEARVDSARVSTECLNQAEAPSSLQHSPKANHNVSDSRFMFANQYGGSSPSSMLSSAFWKKSIFDKIRQPMMNDDRRAIGEGLSEGAKIVRAADQCGGLGLAQNAEIVKKVSKRSKEELRSLWRKAINEQITLLKMEKQNQRLQANATKCDIYSIKLNYKDISYSREVPTLWDKILKQDPTKKVEFVEVARLVRKGVPKQRRGEIWMFLMNQYQLRHGSSFQSVDSEFYGDANQTYRTLLSQLSVQQHDIFVDLGRTFPSHPYYSQYLGIGQLSLFNILKAYSLLDQEVGYCQGLSFVAGILLLHVDTEDEAFELMRHLLFNFGLRKQYLPSMNALHLQLYQMTRLLRDHEYGLFNHFDHYDISPSLYAAPWFLTLFASQFPLGFVARLFDLISLIGIEAIFRISLNLLAYHRSFILACTSLESTMDYMKSDLVKIDDKNLVNIFDKSMSLDLRNKLIEYEIEYTFYCAEDRARFTVDGHHQNPIQKTGGIKNTSNERSMKQDDSKESDTTDQESTSVVADATATVIIQHLLANNHLKSLRSNYSY